MRAGPGKRAKETERFRENGADLSDAAGVLSEAWATVEDSDDLDTFQPHVVHKPHKPVPVAMACRKPHGCEFAYSLSWPLA